MAQALSGLGWEVSQKPDRVVGSHGKHHIMVSFEDDGPSSVIISYVGRGGGLLSSKWQGTERLPSPRKAVRALS